ncbi:glycosyltransferase family 9 protein [Crenobacter cavernae]|uniref:Glycosyltransferase family 9 protein n=1 Tax=Crenobacter cavernae TaxID=2290923 RepID=A0A345Y5S5_9NEIS|nr:glycosyltransferase family 9 protein [Crenobacter cavernae]
MRLEVAVKNSRAFGRLLVFAFYLLRLPLFLFRRRPDDASVHRILILHHLLLGDSLMVVSLLAKARARYPDAEIYLAMPKLVASLFDERPYGVIPIGFSPKDVGSIWRLFRLPRIDLAYLPADNRYGWMARALGARWVIGFAGDRPAHKNWAVDELRPYPQSPMTWSDAVMELIDGAGPAPFSLGQWRVAAEALPFNMPSPYAVLHLGASSALRHWAPENWNALAAAIRAEGRAVVWSCGPGEQGLLEGIESLAEDVVVAGSLSLRQLRFLIAGADYLVSPDTGVAHLGRVACTPTLVLFGPGPATLFGNGAFWQHCPFEPVTEPVFPCRNQQILFFREVQWLRRCERFHGDAPGQCARAQCMEAISVAMVEAGLKRLGY